MLTYSIHARVCRHWTSSIMWWRGTRWPCITDYWWPLVILKNMWIINTCAAHVNFKRFFKTKSGISGGVSYQMFLFKFQILGLNFLLYGPFLAGANLAHEGRINHVFRCDESYQGLQALHTIILKAIPQDDGSQLSDHFSFHKTLRSHPQNLHYHKISFSPVLVHKTFGSPIQHQFLTTLRYHTTSSMKQLQKVHRIVDSCLNE